VVFAKRACVDFLEGKSMSYSHEEVVGEMVDDAIAYGQLNGVSNETIRNVLRTVLEDLAAVG
jgi:hypothetical protein